MEKQESKYSRTPIPTGSISSNSVITMLSPISIGSIQIDLSGYSGLMQDKSTPPCTCNHFSIRGYAAEMRKKNIMTCYPFPTMEGDLDQSGIVLPPLEVPQFRIWKCQNCVNRMGFDLANVAGSSVDGQKDLQEGNLGKGILGSKDNPFDVDGIEDDVDPPPPASMVGRSFREKKRGEASGSMSALIGNSSRSNYGKLASLGSKRLPNLATSSFGLTDNSIVKHKLQNMSNGSGSSNSPKTGGTGVQMNPSVFLGGTRGSMVGSCSKQAEMKNFHHQLSNQSQNNMVINKGKEVEVPLDLNRTAGWPSYTSLLLGQESGRNGMKNRQIPTLVEQEGVGNSKRKRINSDVDSSVQKTRLLTDLMMDSDSKAREFHGKDSGNADSTAGSTSISNSTSKELEASKNLLETFFKPPNLGKKNLLCDLNEEIPPNFEMPISNHQAQQPQLDLTNGGSSSRVQRTDKHTMDQIVDLINVQSSPLVGKNSGNDQNQTTTVTQANLYQNHYNNIEQIAKNTAVINFKNQRVAEYNQSSSPKGIDGNWSSPNSNSNTLTSSSKGSDENWSNPNNINNNNGQKKISPNNNLSIFEKFTENPWIAKRFKIDLNKEAIDPSEAIPAMQLLSLKNATGFKMPSSGFTFGSISSSSSSTQKASSSATETNVINFGPEYLNSERIRESISPFQSMDFEKEKHGKEVKKKGLNEIGESGEGEEGRSKSICVNDFCSMNKNPAEFIAQEVRNEYMINGKDLKFQKDKEKGKGKRKGKVAVAVSAKGKRARTRGGVVVDGRKRKKKDVR